MSDCELNRQIKVWDEKYKSRELSRIKDAVLTYGPQTKIIKMVSKHVKRNHDVLEVGCGTGRLIATLSLRDDINAYGVDYSEKSLALSKKLFLELGLKGNFIRGDLCNLPFADNSFNVLFSESTLEHIKNYEQAMREIARVTRENGYVIISVPNKLRPDGWDLYKKISKPYYTQLSFTPWYLNKLFKKSGLKVIEEFGYDILLMRNISKVLEKIVSAQKHTRVKPHGSVSIHKIITLAPSPIPSWLCINIGVVGTKPHTEVKKPSVSKVYRNLYDGHWSRFNAEDELERRYFRSRYKLALKLGVSPHLRYALDVGCGDGILLALLAKKGVHVTGLDISMPNVKEARSVCKRLGLSRKMQFIRADAEHLPLRSNSFGTVFCLEVIEHLHNHSRVIKELARVTRSDGNVVASSPNFFNPSYLVSAIINRKTGFLKFFISSLKKGYGVEKYKDKGPIHYAFLPSFYKKLFEAVPNVKMQVLCANYVLFPLLRSFLPFANLLHFTSERLNDIWPFKYLGVNLMVRAKKI